MSTNIETGVISLPLRIDNEPQDDGVRGFGIDVAELFLLDPEYRNLNHGSFGTSSRAVQERLRHYQDLYEARPDAFVRYEAPKLLDHSREAVAELLNAPLDSVVFVPNASVGLNTVLRNLSWDADGQDEILYFSSIYPACGKSIDYLIDAAPDRLSAREILLTYPCEDEDVIAAFRKAVAQSRETGKRPQICLFDTISSLPGVRFPFEAIAQECKEQKIFSLVDGAQGIGQIKLDLKALDPDFFTTNCHKWLHVPRGSAVLYVPVRNQGLIASTIPTSHGYISTTSKRPNPLPPSPKSPFVLNFEFTGTLDTSPYLCTADAIKWRQQVLGGEEKIMEYTHKLAKKGGRKAAKILGTKIMENRSGSILRCAMVNVALPIRLEDEFCLDIHQGETAIPQGDAVAAARWLERTMIRDYRTFIPIFCYSGYLWARLSAQVYLGMEDFEWAGRMLRQLSQRIADDRSIFLIEEPERS